MWDEIPLELKEKYKQLILAFASLTEVFSQKTSDSKSDIPAPFINSKYQETAFQTALGASAEDISNTSFDAALDLQKDGKYYKYLIGIKTFGIASGDQKIAQFKANRDEWSALIDRISKNAKNDHGLLLPKAEIDENNFTLYHELALKLADLRNMRIDSSSANIIGFESKVNENVDSIYHVLMPSKKGKPPKIYIGEIPYNKIDQANIKIIGCTSSKNPTNFLFTDGKHQYKFTAADSQLYMCFENQNIIKDSWDVNYADDAFNFFYELAKNLYSIQSKKPKITEEYFWPIINDKGEVEKYSGFNSFYGLGSKLPLEARMCAVERIKNNFVNSPTLSEETLNSVITLLMSFILDRAPTYKDKERKVKIRNKIRRLLKNTGNEEFEKAVLKLLYRPKDELYIPIPNSKTFHREHPDFFGTGIGTFKQDKNGIENNKLALPKDQCRFNLKFEPSGDIIPSFITQDSGKAIESWDKQSILGDWILRGIFQLNEYEPLTSKKLKDVGINTIHIFKMDNSNDIHIEFIWKDY